MAGASEPGHIVDDVLEWVLSDKDHVQPIAADLVPGATAAERQALASLGGIANALLTRPPERLPAAVRAWMEGAPRPPASIVSDLRSAIIEGPDPFAQVYTRMVSPTSRRQLGTVFTPAPIVEFMVSEIAHLVSEPAVVVDPGAGVGAFSSAAHRRWRARVLAVDLNVVTLGLLIARCEVLKLKRVEPILNDYLEWSDGWRSGRGPRIFLGNPPYTRHHDLSPKTRQLAMELSGELIESSLAGLSAYFLAVTLRAMRPDDALSFLLPGSWAESRYGRPLREALWSMHDRRVEMSAFPGEVHVFGDARVTTTILTVGPERSRAQPMTVRLLSLRGDQVRVDKESKPRRTDVIPSSFGLLLWPRKTPRRNLPLAIGDVGQVRRGVATGANDFFFLTDRERLELPEEATLPALCRMRHVSGPILTKRQHRAIGARGDRRWLLWLADVAIRSQAPVRALIRQGVRDRLHLRALTSARHPWYVVEEVAPPALILGPMSKQRLRVVRNDAAVIPSNNLYGLYVDDPEVVSGLTYWLNTDEGQIALRNRARQYGGGLFKVEPRDVLRVRIPGISELREMASFLAEHA
jgi:hypothetical protein